MSVTEVHTNNNVQFINTVIQCNVINSQFCDSHRRHNTRGGERERERETDRQTDRQTDRKREKENTHFALQHTVERPKDEKLTCMRSALSV